MRPSATSAPTSSAGSRLFTRSLAFLFALAVIAMPFALINKAFAMLGQGTDETLHTLLRFCALLGISLLFLQIVTGAFRPLLRKAFHPRTLQRFHTGFGLAGLAFVLCHFVFLIPSLGEHWANLNHGFFVLGPIVLFVLLVTISTALALRRIFRATWSKLHVLNYVVFTVGVIHAMGIGTQGGMLAGRIVLAVFLAVLLAGFTYRASSPQWRRRFVARPVRVRSDGR